MQKTIAYRFEGSDEFFRTENAFPVGGSANTKIDLSRMKSALSGVSIIVPKGMTREEKRKFITSQASAA
jgi:hypothetical protein